METGAWVQCVPDPQEPEATQRTHRAVCMLKKHPGCGTCPHSSFTLVLQSQQDRPRVACPRWEKGQLGDTPDTYEMTSATTCAKRPFPFCAACPSSSVLQEMGVSKSKAGWYGRWKRLQEETNDER